MADLDPREIEQLTAAIQTLTDQMGNLSRAGINVKGKIGEIDKKLEKATKKIVKHTIAVKGAEKELKGIDKELGDVEKQLESYRKQNKRTSDSIDKDTARNLLNRRKALQEEQSNIRKMIGLQEKKLSNAVKQREKFNKLSNKEAKKVDTGSGKKVPDRHRTPDGLRYSVESKKKVIGESKSEALAHVFGEGMGGIKSAFSPASSKGLGGFIQSALTSGSKTKRSAVQMEEWAEAAKGAKNLGVLTKAIGAFSKVLGALSKAGWIGLVIGLAVKLVSAVNTAEKLIAKLNKSFLTLAGPTSGMSNVPKSMEEFNDAIHDLRRNLKLNIMPKDIQDMFGAMSGAGMSLQGVKQNVGSYGKAIQEARVLSIEFGTSMKDMGGMLADNMLTLRDSLENVSASFRKMAFDASKAGISSDKFYRIVNNATASLSFFGNYLKSGSSLLTSFYKAGELGLKDAENAVSGIMKAFSGIDYKKGLKLINVLGDTNVKSLFSKLVENDSREIQAAMRDLNKKSRILGETTDPEKRRKLAEEITASRENLEAKRARGGRLSRAFDAYKRGDQTELALQVGRLAEKPISVISMLMDKANGYTLAEIEIMQNLLNLSQEQTVYVKELLDETKRNFTNFTSANAEILNKVFKGNKSAVEAMQEIVSLRDSGATGAELNAAMGGFRDVLKSQGFSDDQITSFVSSLNTNLDNNMGKPLMKVLNALAEGKSIETAMKDLRLNDAAIASTEKRMTEQETDLMKSTDEKIAEIIKKTATAEDYLNVMKSSAGYLAAKPVAQMQILTGVTTKILGWVETIGRHMTKEGRESAAAQEAFSSIKRDEFRKKKISSEREEILETEARRFRSMFKKDISTEDISNLLSGKKSSDAFGISPKQLIGFMAGQRDYSYNRREFDDITGKWYTKRDRAKANKRLSALREEEAAISKRIKKSEETLNDQGVSYMISEAKMAGEKAFKAGKSSVGEVVAVSSEEMLGAAEKLLKSISEDRGVVRSDLPGEVKAPKLSATDSGFVPEWQKGLLLKESGSKNVKYEVNMGGITINGDADEAALIRVKEAIKEGTKQAIREEGYKNQKVGG